MDCSQKEKKKENRCLVSVYVLLRINCIQNSAGDVHGKIVVLLM